MLLVWDAFARSIDAKIEKVPDEVLVPRIGTTNRRTDRMAIVVGHPASWGVLNKDAVMVETLARVLSISLLFSALATKKYIDGVWSFSIWGLSPKMEVSLITLQFELSLD